MQSAKFKGYGTCVEGGTNVPLIGYPFFRIFS